MSPYRGWRLTVFVVSIVLAVFVPSTVAVLVAHSLVPAPENASDSGVVLTSAPASTVSRTEASRQGPTANNAAVTVDVRNASNVDGRAARVCKVLTEQGFTCKTSNTSRLESSMVRHATDVEDAGHRVAEALGLRVELDSTLPPGTVSVFLGKDYDGPGAQPEPTT